MSPFSLPSPNLLAVLQQRQRQRADASGKSASRRGCCKCWCGLPSCSGSSTPEMVTYKADSAGCDCRGWLRTVLSLHGRPVLHCLPPMLAVFAMAMAATIVKGSHLIFGHQWELPELEATLKEDYALLLTPLTFLLVYRLNRSAVRFYDARAAAGKLIETCRVLAGETVRFCAHDPWACDEICRWVVAFPAATRNFLRGHSRLDDVEGILSSSQILALSKAPVQTLFCCDRMRHAVLKATRSNLTDPAPVSAVMLQTLEGHISTLTGAMGAMERINNTPLPFAYVAHLRTCLTLYLLGLPWILQMESWWSVPMVLLISYALLGVEAAAVACERPFHDQSNHLPFNAFAAVVADNVQQVLQDAADYPSDLPATNELRGGPEPETDRCAL
mmetsp:Transcript_66554/g.156094  ORF Transcript_66554/g.156094 Transcript_66554/m.156094 type:complete len:388 (-) Transcript_66554:185-1348(-)